MDEYGIKPSALNIEVEPEIEEAQLDRVDHEVSKAYFHPSWAAVEEIFLSEIEQLSVKPKSDLSAEEYKIHSLGDERARHTLIAILGRVKDAVTAVESTKEGK